MFINMYITSNFSLFFLFLKIFLTGTDLTPDAAFHNNIKTSISVSNLVRNLTSPSPAGGVILSSTPSYPLNNNLFQTPSTTFLTPSRPTNAIPEMTPITRTANELSKINLVDISTTDLPPSPTNSGNVRRSARLNKTNNNNNINTPQGTPTTNSEKPLTGVKRGFSSMNGKLLILFINSFKTL